MGVEQLLTAYNDEAAGLFRVTMLRVPNTVNLAAPDCGRHSSYSASQDV